MPHLNRKDVLPALRADLVVSRPLRGAGAEVIHVAPEGELSPRAMWGFEFSIARMLDGRRTADEVMSSAARIGLPLDLQSLDGLLHQLEARGFLADAQHPGVGDLDRHHRHRPEWSPEVRELYREALRRARTGDLGGAIETADEVVVRAPENSDALALRTWALEQARAEKPGVPFGEVLHRAEANWRSQTIPQKPEAILPSAGWRIPVLAWVGLLALLIVGVLVVTAPLPRVVLASATFAPVSSEPLLSTRTGMVDDVFVKEGDVVTRGEELLVWNTEADEDALFEAREVLEQVREPIRAAVGQTPVGRPLLAELRAAENQVARAQSELLAAQKEMAGMRFDESILGYERAFEQALARRDLARAAIDALVPVETPEAAAAAEKSMEVELLQGQVRHPYLRSPVSGEIARLQVAPGQYVESFQTLFTIDDTSRLRVAVTVTPRVARQLSAGDRVTAVVNGRPYPSTVDLVVGSDIILRVANPDRALRPGTGAVNLELPARTIF